MRSTSRKSETGGFSIAELMLAMAILTIVSAIAIPMYQGYVATAEMGSVIQEMKQVELILENYKLDTKAYPASLDEVGVNMLDPWGNPYQYLPIEGAGNKAKGHQRKDHNLVPINSDFDLYSMGEDGASSPPLTAKSSRDDIVRANNGGFYGYGKDY
ncbi:MAG: prepilin-type N-terminal cleavage/methylation domain-containing protein [Candidatus Thiodiazotropha sp. (ex Myrtea sp. 'scaly one' KF741663)]|nr:prepilin-type N-terminal cleavage/methylation domain-containing protein [Candidatus Thiodiazotropha sp. (ex Myrtea sp. 'scaly one' KF741663)]